jgi:pyridoxal phosphate enzyme (YggS family)
VVPERPEAVVAGRLAQVRRRIAEAGGDPDAVVVVAVTKGFGPEVADAAVRAGCGHLGENYAQELVAKARQLGWGRGPDAATERPTVHFLGRLQRNKVRQLAPFVDLWQSVDRPEVGAEIARRSPGAAVLVQVDITGEPQKGGCAPAGVGELVRSLAAGGLDVRGLMGVGRAGDDRATRAGFAKLAALADDLHLPVRSMGMSGDLELAVAAGSTMVRVGTDLFGPRPPR